MKIVYRNLLPVIFLLILTPSLWSTVKPTRENMVNRSDVVVVGKIPSVENAGEDERTIYVRTTEVLKGKVQGKDSKLIVNYTRVGKGNIDFLKLSKERYKQIFYLKKVNQSDSSPLILADAWFGVETAYCPLLSQIRNIVDNK